MAEESIQTNYDSATIYSIGAVLGIADCDAEKLEAYYETLDLLSQQMLLDKTQSNHGRAVAVGSFLNNLIADPVSGIGFSSSRTRDVRDHLLDNGCSPLQCLYYPYVVGQAQSKGYHRIQSIEFPFDYDPHWGYRFETFSIYGTLGDASILVRFRRMSETPPFSWDGSQISHSVWQITCIINGAYSVYTIPGGIESHFQGGPLQITIGTEFTLDSTGSDDNIFPIRLAARDVNQGTSLDLQLLHSEYVLPFCIGCENGMGWQGYGAIDASASGTVNGNPVGGTVVFVHDWENSFDPYGFSQYYVERSLTVFPLASSPPKTGFVVGTWSSRSMFVWTPNSYVVYVDGDEVDATVTFINYQERGNARYPSTVLVRSSDGSLSVTLDAVPYIDTAFINVGSEEVEVWNMETQANLNDVPGDAWLSCSSFDTIDQLTDSSAKIIGVYDDETTSWVRPSTTEQVEVFFYWFIPAIIVLGVIGVIVYVSHTSKT